MKAIGPRAKKVMDVLTANCPHKDDCDTFHTAPYRDVVVEYISKCNLGAMYSIAYHYTEESFEMYDPQMCFIKGGEGEYYPYYNRDTGHGVEDDVLLWGDCGDMGPIKSYDVTRQGVLVLLAESMMWSIKQQQERAV